MKKYILLTLLVTVLNSNAQEPLISHIYAADPSAHVWSNDTNTLWLYTSHDKPGTNHHATMFDYHVFSTKDMVNWIDHGRILSIDDVDWAISHAWAVDAAYWHGKYYLIFCMRIREDSEKFKIGIAVSNQPQGPFRNLGVIAGIDEGMDPSIFIENGQPYLIWANSRHCYISELNTDLLSIKDETITDITKGLPQLQEGPWLHKYNNKYYLSYPGLRDNEWPEVMYYSIADTPFGPYKFKGQYIPYFEGQAGSNHGSIVSFKDKWYAFYHSAHLSRNNEYTRNLMVDFLEYNIDGSIKTIMPLAKGVREQQQNNCIIVIEAENGKTAGGKLDGVFVDNAYLEYSGDGYVTGFDQTEDYVEVLVQLAKDSEYLLSVAYAAEKDIKIAVLYNDFMLNGGYGDWKDIVLPKTDKINIRDISNIKLKTGDNRIRIMSKSGDFKIDYFMFKLTNKWR